MKCLLELCRMGQCEFGFEKVNLLETLGCQVYRPDACLSQGGGSCLPVGLPAPGAHMEVLKPTTRHRKVSKVPAASHAPQAMGGEDPQPLRCTPPAHAAQAITGGFGNQAHTVEDNGGRTKKKRGVRSLVQAETSTGRRHERRGQPAAGGQCVRTASRWLAADTPGTALPPPS